MASKYGRPTPFFVVVYCFLVCLFRDHTFSRLLVLLYLLHLLDFNWQDYDHTLLKEMNLPELYLNSAISESVTSDLKWAWIT